ncbi:helix-turn-helix domain-containing protein [Streptomyces sp. NPDC006458]|uniref:helix-turn-helix domain-containing protein n=1 Tax=Streptomyces sp. NPDC006458 TaxID=3154302 RepID=UPI0033A7AE83
MLRTPTSELRLEILELMKDPAAHFPPGRLGGTAEDGVTAEAVAVLLGLRSEAAATHLRFLADLGLLRARRVRRSVHYRRDEIRIAEVARMFEKGW